MNVISDAKTQKVLLYAPAQMALCSTLMANSVMMLIRVRLTMAAALTIVLAAMQLTKLHANVPMKCSS